MALYILLMSPNRAMGYVLNFMRMSVIGGYNVGPTARGHISGKLGEYKDL